MCYRIAEINEEAVAEKLGYVTTESPDDVGANPSVVARQIVQFLRVELSGKRG
jgi:hypothetical protein